MNINEALDLFNKYRHICVDRNQCILSDEEACPCENLSLYPADVEEADQEEWKAYRKKLKQYGKYKRAYREKIDFTPNYTKKCKYCSSTEMIYTEEKMSNGGCHIRAWCMSCYERLDAVTQLKNQTVRSNTEHNTWAENVKRKDGYKCVICGSEENLEAHHIIPFGYKPDIQGEFGERAGITLCREHHKMVTDSYNVFRKYGKFVEDKT